MAVANTDSVVHTAGTEADTFALGEAIGRSLRPGDVVLLSGQLGAGKTVFTKGIAAALGVHADEVHSPSFTLVNFYPGALPLYHIDLYRLNASAETAYAVDLDEILQDASAVVVIEWAERLGNFPLPATVWRVSIEGDGDEPRSICISRPVGSPR
ncbi:MAG: tRNA (adenosine(37)-N6)-threonylcarbamoyltransferase complex ATPase subunit type 1 TsaE [Pyrinomonadaceae bacterium]